MTIKRAKPSRYIFAAMAYVAAVLSGEVQACKWVRLACQRQVDDLQRSKDPAWPYEFNEKKAHRVCKFMEGLVHIKGPAARPRRGVKGSTLIKLMPWQCFIVTTLFGWQKRSDNLRRFVEAYLELPRKNGKSTKAAGIGLYMFVGDDEVGAEVYSGATTEKQAMEVFSPARLMALNSPRFKQHYGLTVGMKNLHITDTASKFEPLVGEPGEGANPSCAIADERHEHRTDRLYDAMQTGMGAREQPLLLSITTAGDNIAGPCYQQRTQVTKMLEGIEGFERDDLFAAIWTIDKDDDWTDFDVWKKANPNYGVSLQEDYLQRQYKTAMTVVNKRNVLLCRHLNVWNRTHTAWMDMLAWNRCADPDLRIERFAGKPCWIGLDLASKVDMAALRIWFREPIINPKTPDEERHRYRYFVFGKYYLPEDTVERKENEHYRNWRALEHLTVTDGAIIDIGVIEDDLLELKSNFEIQAVGYDPYQATQMSVNMRKEGVPMVEIPATVKNYSEPMKETEALVLAGLYQHDGNPIQSWMVSNVVAHMDAKDNIFPRKEADQNKIDGLISDIMALGEILRTEPKTSVYDRREVRMVG